MAEVCRWDMGYITDGNNWAGAHHVLGVPSLPQFPAEWHWPVEELSVDLSLVQQTVVQMSELIHEVASEVWLFPSPLPVDPHSK